MMNTTTLPTKEDVIFRNAVCALVDHVREHDRSYASEIIKPVLAALAFGIEVTLTPQMWSLMLDSTRLDQLLTAIKYRGRLTWPADYVPDSEIRDWMGLESGVIPA